MSKSKAKNIDAFRSILQSEYFFGNKPELKQSLPNILFSKIPGRKDKHQMYSQLDGSHETLFPKMLSKNVSIVGNLDLDKIPGRSEHGLNMARRKVQNPQAQLILKQIKDKQMKEWSKKIITSTISFNLSLSKI